MKKNRSLHARELAFIAGTRAAFGAGALIFGDLLARKEKKAVVWTLFLLGVATTVPILAMVISRRRG